jgi:hypothetical protein
VGRDSDRTQGNEKLSQKIRSNNRGFFSFPLGQAFGVFSGVAFIGKRCGPKYGMDEIGGKGGVLG